MVLDMDTVGITNRKRTEKNQGLTCSNVIMVEFHHYRY